jgi:hypothetical protein
VEAIVEKRDSSITGSATNREGDLRTLGHFRLLDDRARRERPRIFVIVYTRHRF